MRTHRTVDYRSERHCVRKPKRTKRPTAPLDAGRQSLAVAFMGSVRAMAFVYHRRYAHDLPRDEIVSAALSGLVYAASRFKPARGIPFRNYAIMVVHHAMKEAARRWRAWRAGPWLTDDDGETIDVEIDPHDALKALATAEAVEGIKAALPARSFEILRLRFAEGLTLADIGRRLGFSHQYAAQLVNEAIGRLRQTA